MPRFPHLKSGEKFPYLDRANPFERTTDFDYERYDYTATVKLCSVTWPMDYRHVPYWLNEGQRNNWFEDLEGHVVELAQGFTRVQTDSVVVDVPYDEALTYNYVYMRVPMLTEHAAIRHEGTTGIRTICAHIQDCLYQSPSTTELILSVDMWTTYMPYLSVHQMMLRRGHAPMYAVSASDYLADPVNNCAHLLTPDVNYGGEADVVRSGTFKPLSTAEPMYILASTIPYADIATMAEAHYTTATAPTFSDTGARNGHQVDVGGYAWNTYGSNALYNPSSPTACVDGSTPSGLYYYGFYASAISSIKQVLTRYPLIAQTCRALYVVPSDLINIGQAHTVATITFYEVRSKPGLQTVGDFTLSKSMFGYPTEYADIAKLYTSPYATLEIADNLGNAVDLRIENCHNALEVVQHLNAAFPFLSWDAMLANYASSGSTRATYTWAKYDDGSSESRQIPNADFIETAISFGIDTYELRMDAAPMAQLDSYFDAKLERERAIVGYQSTMRSANTGYENARDSNATANTNALASNATANTNALNSNATANTNALNSNTTAKQNSDTSAQTAKNNAYNSADNDYANVLLNGQLNAHLAIVDTTSQEQMTYFANQNVYNHQNTDWEYMQDELRIVQQSEAFNAVAGMVASALAGNIAGAALAGSNYLFKANIVDTQDFQDTSFQMEQHTQITQANNTDTSDEANSRTDERVTSQIDTSYDVATNNRSTAKTNADNVKSSTNANTNRSKSTSDANANRTKSTSDANANRTKSTSDANANRTKSTSDANAGYSRATTEENAKNALLVAQDAYTDGIQSAGVSNPNAYGSYSGDGLASGYRMRGLHLRAKTQSDSAIARTGDTFLRYGYTYDGIWNVGEWCDADHFFCYWQANDLWLRSSDIANPQAERALESILDAGVTVWRDPDMIGAIAI